jgi:hypothetical protein
VVLILTMMGFLVVPPRNRRVWLSPGPYLTALVTLLVISFHVAWEVQSGLPSLHYAAGRLAAAEPFIGHIFNPLVFAASQLLVLLPLVLAALPLTGFPWRLKKSEGKARYQRDFLAVMTLGPFLLCLALSLAFNLRLIMAYGSAMWTYCGLLMLSALKIRPAPRRRRAVWVGCAVMASLFVAAEVVHDVAGPYVFAKPSRCHFPGRTLAAEVDARWKQQSGRPLPVVSGDWWLAANVAYYGLDRPVVYPSLRRGNADDLVLTPDYIRWMSDERFLRLGGVIVWDAESHGEKIPNELRGRFPSATAVDVLEIPYVTGAGIPPARIGVAIVPPAD